MSKLIDLIGQNFNNCTILERSKKRSSRGMIWVCKCICGNIFEEDSKDIRNNKDTNCGCIKRHSKPKYNLTNKKINNFIVLEISKDSSERDCKWLCKCNCGKIFKATSRHIRQNIIYSCGCITRRKKTKLSSYKYSLERKYNTYKRMAKKRNFSFILTIEEFYKISQQNCYYCNSSPYQIYIANKTHKKDPFIYNGIDRKNNNQGYLKENCVPCCGVCNWIKNKLNIDVFLEYVKKIYENLNLQNRRVNND